jgi:hypothetical protein
MTQVTLKQLADSAEIEQEKLLQHMNVSLPHYKGENIHPETAFSWIPGLRMQTNILNISESIRLINTLRQIATLPPAGGPASATPKSEGDTTPSRTGTNSLNQRSNTMSNEYSEEAARKQWNSDPSIQEEFHNFDSYNAYLKAAASGLIKVHGSTNVVTGEK